MIRRVLFLLFGLLLGGVSVAALANAPTRIPLNVPVSAPAGVVVSGAWDAVVPGLEDTGYGGYRAGQVAGSAEIYRGVAVRVDGVPATLSASRSITPARLGSAISRGVRRPGGFNPAGLAIGVLLDLGFEYVSEQWLMPVPVPAYPYAREFSGSTGGQDPWFPTPEQACVRLLRAYGYSYVGVGYVNGNPVCRYRADNPGYWVALSFRARPCDAGFVNQSGNCVPQNADPVPASEQDLADRLAENLVDGDLPPAQALQEAMNNGWLTDGDFDPTVVTGPSSITGPTTTSTTSGPAGQTSTTTQNRYDMEYVPSGVVIKPTTTTSTTTPDGQTTTSTTTTTGASGQAPQKPAEPEKPLCELFPDASGCEKLGNPAEDIALQTRDLDISSLNYQSVSGSCPGPKTIATSHGSYELSYEPVCTAADFLRPVIVLSGLLTAGIFVFMGARRAS